MSKAPTGRYHAELTELAEANRGRLAVLARQGTPLQLNGIEPHLLQYLIAALVGEDAVEHAMLEWERKVAQGITDAEAQIRQAQLMQGVQGYPQNG